MKKYKLTNNQIIFLWLLKLFKKIYQYIMLMHILFLVFFVIYIIKKI